jgi:hypothetical protein
MTLDLGNGVVLTLTEGVADALIVFAGFFGVVALLVFWAVTADYLSLLRRREGE